MPFLGGPQNILYTYRRTSHDWDYIISLYGTESIHQSHQSFAFEKANFSFYPQVIYNQKQNAHQRKL